MGQLIEPPIDEYVRGLTAVEDEHLRRVAGESRRLQLPLVDAQTGALLRLLARMTGARRILEIGTAIGYSALWMAAVLPDDGMLISMEIDATRAAGARRHFEEAGVAGRTSVIVGDASRLLHKMSGPFDVIFQDGDKLLYSPMLDRLVTMLRPGGVLVSDNVLWGGEVVAGFVAEPRRSPESVEAIRDYNERLRADARLDTLFLPIGDGVAVAVKK